MPADFDDRFEELWRMAYRVAYRLRGPTGADDVASETLMAALRSWPDIQEPRSWVAAVAARRALRRRLPLPGSRPREVDPLNGERVDLVRALRRLPKRQQEVVALRYLADLTEVSVAETLGITVGTVKVHAARGLASLRCHLDPSDDRRLDPAPNEGKG